VKRILSLAPDEPPPDRGPLLTPAEAAADPELFNGKVKPQYVRRNVRPLVRLGHSTVMVYKLDVRDWIEQRRQA